MQGKESVIAEQVQRPALGQASHQHVMFPLIEKGTGLLAAMGRGDVLETSLGDGQRIGDGPPHRLDGEGELLVLANRGVVAQQHAARRQRRVDRIEDVMPYGLESGREQLRHHEIAVPVHDQRRKPVSLAVDDPECGGGWLESRAARVRLSDPRGPPVRRDRGVVGREEPQADFRHGTPERLTHEPSAGIGDRDDAGLRGSLENVGSVNPGVPALPARRPAPRYDRSGAHRGPTHRRRRWAVRLGRGHGALRSTSHGRWVRWCSTRD